MRLKRNPDVLLRILRQPYLPRILARPRRSRILRSRPRNTALSLLQQFLTRRQIFPYRICKVPPLEGTYLQRPLKRTPNRLPRSMTLRILRIYRMVHLPRLLLT